MIGSSTASLAKATPPRRAGAPRARTGAEIVRRMAEVMRERMASTGACLIDDLFAAGFTTGEIIAYSDDARGLALRLFGFPVDATEPGPLRRRDLPETRPFARRLAELIAAGEAQNWHAVPALGAVLAAARSALAELSPKSQSEEAG